MGYEIKVTYSSQGDETSSTKTIKVGKADEDVSVECLAARIMGVMANRSRTVESIELAEFRRKPVSFREDAEGIWIGNKKFRFDAPPNVAFPADVSAETIPEGLVEAVRKAMEANTPTKPALQPHQQTQPNTAPAAPAAPAAPLDPQKVQEAIKAGKQPHELLVSLPPGAQAAKMKQVYQPNGDYDVLVKRQNIFLSIGQVYDIMATKTGPMGDQLFYLEDNKKKKVWVDSIHFDQPNISNVGVRDQKPNDDLLGHGTGYYENLTLR